MARLPVAAGDIEALLGERDGDPLAAATTTPAEDILGRAFASLPPEDPQAPHTLAAWLHGLCLRRWELSDDYRPIRAVLRALTSTVEAPGHDGSASRRLLALMAMEAGCLEPAMDAEDVMNCSCPVAMADRANEVARLAAEVIGGTPPPPSGLEGPRALLVADAETHRVTYGAVAQWAEALLALVEADEQLAGGEGRVERELAVGKLTGAIDEMSTAIDVLVKEARGADPDRYASELGTHLATARIIRDRAWEPRIHLDRGEVVYLYPFALDWLSGEKGGEKALKLAAVKRWTLRSLGDVGEIQPVQLTDMWEPTGPHGPTYRAASLALPRLRVETTAFDVRAREGAAADELADLVVELEPEIRFTSFGNHHLRISGQLRNATLHELNQALRRPCGSMGSERFFVHGASRTWHTLVDYARDVIHEVAATLESREASDRGPTTADATRPRGAGDPSAAVLDPEGDFHVVVATQALSIRSPDSGGAPIINPTLDQMASTLGRRLLFNPITQLATSLEEWVRYPDPLPVNLLGTTGYAGDIAVRTANTTIIHMPDSPLWLIDEVCDAAEFVGTIPVLLKVWKQAALTQAETLVGQLEAAGHPGDHALDVVALLTEEARMRAKEAEIQVELARLRAPGLVRTRPQRAFLDELWDESELRTLEADLNSRLEAILTQHSRASAAVEAQGEHARRQAREAREASELKEEKARRRFERGVQTWLGVLAAASVAGAFSWLNDLWRNDHADWARAAEILIIFLLVVLTWFVLRSKETSNGPK